MNKTISKLFVLIGVFPLMVACNLSQRYTPKPIVTPGSIDLVNDQKNIPEILDWRYDVDHILVYRPGSFEGTASANLFSWNWHTGDLQPIPIPDLAPDHRLDAVRNSKLNLIGYSYDKDIYLFNLNSLTREKITSGDSLDISPDGQSIVFFRDNKLIKMNLKDRAEQILSTWNLQSDKDWMAGYVIRWSSNGKFLVFMKTIYKSNGNEEDTIDYFDLDKMEDRMIDQGSFIGSLSLSPDSKLLTYVRNPILDDAELVIFDLVHNCVVGSKNIPGQDFTASWSPDGSKIIIGYFGAYYFVNVEKVFGKPYDQLNCSQ